MQTSPCPNCGGTEFVRGKLAASGASHVFFVADNRGIGDFFLERKKGDVVSRMCEACHRLDLFVEGYFDDPADA